MANSATLWLFVPNQTPLGIVAFRVNYGIQTPLALAGNPAATGQGSNIGLLIALTAAVVWQVVFLRTGHLAMHKNGFHQKFVRSGKQDVPNTFTLVCRGVAIGVLDHFCIRSGWSTTE